MCPDLAIRIKENPNNPAPAKETPVKKTKSEAACATNKSK